jgi:large subunit ribosomal protein L5
MLRFKERYNKEVVPKMVEKFGYRSVMAVPRIKKVLVNTGFGRQVVGLTADEQKKVCQNVVDDLSLICGQKPVLTLSKKSIASFKLRKGMQIGAKVTLRGKRMEDFIDRLVRIALPRSRDFQGISPESIGPEGNLTLGIKEQITFPEVSPESTKRLFGLEVTVVVTSKSREEGMELLKLLGFPIKSVSSI